MGKAGTDFSSFAVQKPGGPKPRILTARAPRPLEAGVNAKK